ncbi:MAG: tetratricopeptide repeat protein [Calditrichaeota bacterium]|nr:MAG: tetratricopeptide repeat protein [Calditrichota bacterium]
MSLAQSKVFYFGYKLDAATENKYKDEIKVLKKEIDELNIVKFPDHKVTLAEINCRIGERLLALQDFGLAKKFIEKTKKELPTYADSLESLYTGILFLKEKKYEEALEFIINAQMNFIRMKDRTGIGFASFNLALCHLGLEQYDLALDNLFISNRSLSTKRKTNILVAIKINLGNCYYKLNLPSEAENVYVEAIQLAKKIENTEQSQAFLFFNLGLVQKQRENFEKSKKSFSTARDIFYKLDHLKGISAVDTQLKNLEN